MLKFIRTVDKSLEDILILNLKARGYLVDNVDDHSPNKLRRVLGHFTKEFSDGFVRRKASCRCKHVVLHVAVITEHTI